MKNERLAAIAADPDFREVVLSAEKQLTARVMATTTSPEDREKALAEYHGLRRVLTRLQLAIQDESQKEE